VDTETFAKKHLKGYADRCAWHSKLPGTNEKHAKALTKFKAAFEEHHKEEGDHETSKYKCMHSATS
jgi:hypothetical protein